MRLSRSLLLLVVLLVTFVTAGGIAYAVVPTPSAITACNVVAAGADANGVNPSDVAFADAVTCAVNNKVPVYVPRGVYRLNARFNIPQEVTVIGEDAGAFGGDGAATISTKDSLPKLVFLSSLNPAISIGPRAALSGFYISFHTGATTLTHTNQATTSTTVYIGNPGSSGAQTATGVRLTNLKIEYPGIGINAPDNVNAGRYEIENVFINHPRTTGVYLGQARDVARIADVHVWRPSVGVDAGSRGFVFGINDFMIAENLSVFAMDIAFDFNTSDGQGGTVASATGLVADYSNIGVRAGSSTNLALSGGTLVTHHRALVVNGNAKVAVSGTQMDSNAFSAVLVDSSNSIVTISGATIDRSDCGFQGAHGIEVSQAKHLVFTGNSLTTCGHGIWFHNAPFLGTITGNTIHNIQAAGASPGVPIGGNQAGVQVSGNAVYDLP